MTEVETFEDWYRDLRRRLIVALRALGATDDLADEVADETLLKAYERWSEVSQMDNPAGWTYVVARNALRARARRGDVRKKLASLRPELVEREPVLSDFDAMIATLPPRRRHVVILRYVFNLTEPEIAKALGVPRGTVSSRLRSSHAQLRRQLTEQPT